MPVRNVRLKPARTGNPSSVAAHADSPVRDEPAESVGDEPAPRYRRLPAGTHGLDPEEVRRDQRERLQAATIELIARHGYQAVRILDITKLARISRPTFYSLYTSKEELFLGAYDEIASRTADTIMHIYDMAGSRGERLQTAIGAFAELAAAEPEAISLVVLGAFGAGTNALQRRNGTLEAMERSIRSSDEHASAGSGEQARSAGSRKAAPSADLTVKVIIGGVREVSATRLREGRASELPALAGDLAAWAASYPPTLPAALKGASPARRGRSGVAPDLASERARRTGGRLPSGRHDLPRQFIVKSQRERIVDATAAIVAAKGIAGLTVPEIARRASVSHQTFYEMYQTKRDAFLGAQKVGMHQALLVTAEAYQAHEQDWPRAVAAGLSALIDYLSSEPAHAHLSLVDTFAASPEALEIRDSALRAFAAYLVPGYALAPKDIEVPAIAAEAIAGGIWQVLHHYIENERIGELPDVAPQIIYMALTPFLGPRDAVKAARHPPARSSRPRSRKAYASAGAKDGA